MTILRCIAAALSFLTAACAPVNVLNALTTGEGYRVERNIAYGAGPLQALDLYIPDTPADHPSKMVVFVHGGRWQSGDRTEYRFVAQALAAMGYMVAVADYRVYPEVKYPAFVEDTAAAAEWAHTHAGDYGGDPEKIYLMGHSAGAYNVAMAALDKRYLRGAKWLKGVIGLAGPYDFLPFTDKDIQDIFGTAKDVRDTQPVTHVTTGAPPMLLLTGDADEAVEPRNTYRLAEALKAKGNNVEVKTYPGIGHIKIVLALSRFFDGAAPTKQDVQAFIEGH